MRFFETIKFEYFLLMSKSFYISIGVEPYVKAYGNTHYYLLDIFFLINIINMNFVFFSELAYVYMAMYNGNNFVEATNTLSYAGFVFVGNIKIFSVLLQKSELTRLMHDLHEIYPHAKKRQQRKRENVAVKRFMDYEQKEYEVNGFVWRYNLISFAYALIHLILEWTYNLFPLMNHLLYDTTLILPYNCWVPFKWRIEHWSYYAMYASQNLAGHTCMMGQLANDLLLCAVIAQVIMHYQFLAKCISNYKGEEKAEGCGREGGRSGSVNGDLKFLENVIQYHQKLLSLSNVMNDVFGVSLLMNFMASAFTMCFLGFQMTMGVDTFVLVKLMLFIFCSLVQLYMLTNYGQELILASENIGHAVYNHEWFNGSLRYKKMLVLIIKRAQKPAILKATTFLNVNLGTMTDLIQLSYKFFALLRTMYSK